MSKYKNAGISNKSQARLRLEAGEVFYWSVFMDSGTTIKYDASFIMKGESPYRYGNFALKGVWNKFDEWYVESKWYEDIPERGILCWVRDGRYEDGHLARVIKYNTNPATMFPYVTDAGIFIYATPLTNEEIKEFLL